MTIINLKFYAILYNLESELFNIHRFRIVRRIETLYLLRNMFMVLVDVSCLPLKLSNAVPVSDSRLRGGNEKTDTFS